MRQRTREFILGAVLTLWGLMMAGAGARDGYVWLVVIGATFVSIGLAYLLAGS